MPQQGLEAEQLSSHNPGWAGPGIPTARYLLVSRPAAALRLAGQGQLRHSAHVLVATAADAWGFSVAARLGRRVSCPCCGWQGPAFRATANQRAVTFQSRCPQCDSRSRHRGLTRVLPAVLHRKPEGRILFFAPEGVLLGLLARHGQADSVVTTDRYSTDVDCPGEDIQRLSFASGSFAMLMCNHVLEHVPDDERALAECARVLVTGGLAVITVPGDFDRPHTRTFTEPDGSGHYRHYGLDLIDRLRGHFASVEAVDMSTLAEPAWHVFRRDMAFVGVK